MKCHRKLLRAVCKIAVSVFIIYVLIFLVGCPADRADFYISSDTVIYTPSHDGTVYYYESDENLYKPKDTIPGPEPLPDTNEAVDDTTELIDKQESLRSDGELVYWVSGGEVWHIDEECSALLRSKEIISGSINEAIRAGKSRVCKRCS